LVGSPESKRPFGRYVRRWEDNIKMNLKKTGRECVEWIDLVHNSDRWWVVVKMVMNFRVPYKSGEFLE
jgi:hypothetical protein